MSIIKKNLTYQSITQAGSKGLMFIVYMLLARILGPTLYGTFDYTFSIIQIVGGVFIDLGLVLIVTRELSSGNTDVFLPSILLKFVGCIIGSTIIFIISISVDLSLILVSSLIGFTIFNSFTNLYICLFRSYNRMLGEAITVIIQRAVLVLILYLIYIEFFIITYDSGLSISGTAFSRMNRAFPRSPRR